MRIIDSHIHLWKKQNGLHNGKPVYSVGNGKSMFGGEVRQMMPPYMLNGENNAEMLIANMDYARVAGGVCVQEVMDGNQDDYLLSVKKAYGDRIKICSLYEENDDFALEGFDGIKLCSCKFKEQNLLKHMNVFEKAAEHGKFIAIDMADGDAQTHQLEEIICSLPDLKIAIGHFGMVTRENWEEQIKLARHKNVYIESGGITWLFNSEFYPYKSAVNAILNAAAICGFEKLMWGSDYPRTMTEITYKMSYDFVLKSNDLSDAEKEMLLYKNAKSFYGFNELPEYPKIKNMLED